MLPIERQRKIASLIKANKIMTMKELIAILDVSMDTLRRDIQQLLNQGKVKKFYGGIEYVEPNMTEIEMDKRMVSMANEKQAIAKLCSEQIKDGDCIYLDSGTTTFKIASYIKQKKNLTILTNSLPVVLELTDSEVDVIMVGGKIRKEEKSVFLHDSLFQIDALNIDKAFICAGGISVEKGVSDYHIDEAITRRKIIEIAREVYVAADSTKFGKDVLVGITSLEKIDCFITDQHLANYYRRAFKQADAKLLIAPLHKKPKYSLSIPADKTISDTLTELIN